MTSKTTDDDAKTQVFDVGSWLDRPTVSREPAESDYLPKHRAEGPAV